MSTRFSFLVFLFLKLIQCVIGDFRKTFFPNLWCTIAQRQLKPINYRKSLAIMIISWLVWLRKAAEAAPQCAQKELFFMILLTSQGEMKSRIFFCHSPLGTKKSSHQLIFEYMDDPWRLWSLQLPILLCISALLLLCCWYQGVLKKDC